ncbi:alpha/beta hydrolase [Streptomyces sp. Ru71]|uniref:alpha/beta hydrolase n=1 Tax=Streptomyces sp. Ru71 TaxID=2080746 RepID=UPI000CDD226A|nr:alpha/beta hydrolase [Streptomyces sp. Ru71]POX57279.1 alpha/beta hydrolase [Streptomyces sp. Ru71]
MSSVPLSYGELPDQVADLFLPHPDGAEERLPLVLLFHGGFWRAEHDRRHVEPFARALAQEAGCAVASVEYRRVGAGGGWPTTLTDTARAVDLLPSLAASAAPGRIDPERVAYAGHSAGGHLALWAAARHRLPAGAPGRIDTPPPTRGVLALAPTADLAAADALGSGRGAVAAFLGGARTAVPDRYAAADPAALGMPAGRTVLVHGTADEALPITMARTYADATGATLHEVPDGSHFDVIDPASPAWPTVVAGLRSIVLG